MGIVFFLAEDLETGTIVDDAYIQGGGENQPGMFASKSEKIEHATWRSRDICRSYRLQLIDSDGPHFQNPLQRPKPRWEDRRPHTINAARWATRLRSTDDLALYRKEVAAGRIIPAQR